MRAHDRGKTIFQRPHDLARIIDRKRCLRRPGEHLGVGGRKPGNILDAFDELDRASRQLADGADHLGMTGVADQDDRAAALVMNESLAVDLGHERAGRINGEEIALAGHLGNRLRHAVGREDHRRRSGGNLIEVVDEYRALGAQGIDNVAVVDNLVAHIDRRSVNRQRAFHRVDGAHHAGTETTWRGEQDPERRLGHDEPLAGVVG